MITSSVLLVSTLVSGEDGAGCSNGMVVEAIAFRGSARDIEGLREGLPIRRGEAFTFEAMQQSTKLLERKELFSSISASCEAVAGKARVSFHVEAIPLLRKIEIEGNRAISDGRLRRQIRIKPGQLLTSEQIGLVLKRIEGLYRREGFDKVKVTVKMTRSGARDANLRCVITEGLPRIVEEIRLEGEVGFAPAPLLREIPIRVGSRLRRGAIKEARQSLLRFYRRRGYFDARVSGRWLSTGASRGVAVFAINAGHPWRLKIEGNRVLSDKRLLASIDLERRPVITAGTWRELARRIREAYLARGFASVEVEASLNPHPPKIVTLRVREGRRVRVGKLAFTGNSRYSDDRLRAEMQTAKRPLFGFGPQPVLVERQIKADIERITALYHGSGFLDASVKVIKEYRKGGKVADITVEVTEGPFYFIRQVELDVKGQSVGIGLPEELQAGRPYIDELPTRTKHLIMRQLADQGYAEAAVEVEASRGSEEGGKVPVDLKLTVSPGHRFTVGAITVAGNSFTREHVIRRELGLEPGAVLDGSKIAEAQRNIYRLGFFRSARVEILPKSVSGEPLARDLVVRIAERPAGNLEYGFGYDTREGLRSFGELSHSNLWGTGRRVSLRANLGFDAASLAPNEYFANAGVRLPRFWDSRFSLFGNVIPLRSERAVDEFSVERVMAIAGAERTWGARFRTTWQVEFENGRIFDVAPDARLVGADQGRLREVTLNPITVFDSRDDPFLPTRGVFESLRLRYGAPAIGSGIHFIKLNAQHSQYLSLGAGIVGLYSIRFGYARSLGVDEEVPIRERFFLGGRTSVRGFSENAIGPRGEFGSPTGGDLLVNINSELRFPIRGRLIGALFLDGGGLYLSRRSVNLRDFRRAAGIGIRYLTPIGPISLDYGFKLDRRRGEAISQFHFSIGTLF